MLSSFTDVQVFAMRRHPGGICANGEPTQLYVSDVIAPHERGCAACFKVFLCQIAPAQVIGRGGGVRCGLGVGVALGVALE